jgi:hypothetical protein
LRVSANENTVNAGKKTISPADVFKALEETEFAFLKEPLEAEFASMSFIGPAMSFVAGQIVYYKTANNPHRVQRYPD